MADFSIVNEGSLVLFTPLTSEAKAFAAEAFAEAMIWGNAYVVEHRYAGDIAYDLAVEQGFVLDVDGNTVYAAETEEITVYH